MKDVFTRQVSATVLAQMFTLVASLGANAIIARQLGPEGKGEISLILLIPGVLQLFFGLGLNTANVYYAGSKRISIRELTENSVLLFFVSTLTGVLTMTVLSWTPFIRLILNQTPVSYMWLGMIALPVGLVSNQLGGLLQGLERIFTLNLMTVLQAALTLPLLAAAIIWLKLGITGAILATIISQLVFVVLIAIHLSSYGAHFRPRWNLSVIRSTLSYGAKSYVGNLIQFFNYRLDMFLVNFFLGSAGVGIYAISVSFAELLWQLPNAAGYVIFPKAANSTQAVMNSVTPKVLYGVLFVSVIGSIVLVLFGKIAIQILFSAHFLPAYSPMLALLPGVLLLGGAKILANDLAGRGYPHYNSIAAGVSLAVTVALDVVLIPSKGVLGAALASTFSYTLTFLVSVIFYIRVTRQAKASRMTDRESLEYR